MSRSKSSGKWLKEHFDDPFVKKAQKEGYRSRASYKLLEIQERDKIFKPGMTVIDLGAAPGGWSQVAAKFVGVAGKVIASDILPMDSFEDVEFVQGDFNEEKVFNEILSLLNGQKVDLVISDMAPNMSGMKQIDQPRSIYLVELALDLAKNTLKPGGAFLTKVFHGEGFDELLADMRRNFTKVQTRKPQASRSRSREVYQLATEYRL